MTADDRKSGSLFSVGNYGVRYGRLHGFEVFRLTTGGRVSWHETKAQAEAWATTLHLNNGVIGEG